MNIKNRHCIPSADLVSNLMQVYCFLPKRITRVYSKVSFFDGRQKRIQRRCGFNIFCAEPSRYLEGLRADVVVINRVSKTLPIDEEEFQRFWPDSMLVFVPYEPKQEIAIVQGQPVVGDSDAVISAMIQVIATIQGGEHIATAV